MNYFFITGLYRSGTTLLQKILQSHLQIFSLDQPLPNLYYHLKSSFYKERNIIEKNILGILFPNEHYELDEFISFANNQLLNEKDFEIIFKQAKSFSGVNSDKVFNISTKLQAAKLNEVYHQICDLLAKEYNNENTTYRGSKEIIAEEYIPYFLNKKIKVILIVRDIRDVINSLNYGKGNNFTGEIRPTLFNIRNWRKSVAYSIKYKNNTHFLSIKYEDLIHHTPQILTKVSDFLQISEFTTESYLNSLKDQNNKKWQANSSFENYDSISNKSIGKYKSNFSSELIEYIEKLCLPELVHLNYEVENTRFNNLTFLDTFKEPFAVNHKLFDKSYSIDNENIKLEKNRLNYLLGNKEINKKRYFIFDQVADVLKKEMDYVTRN